MGISFVISSFNRPAALLTCVASLLQQEGQNEIIICDNTPEGAEKERICYMVDLDPSIRLLDTHKQCPPDINAGYKAQNIGSTIARCDWLCFPSDDCYYVPGFSKIMQESAEQFPRQILDLVYCDFLYDPRYNRICSEGIYAVVPAYPRLRFMDKSNFIMRRKHFTKGGFDCTHPNGYGDWLLINHLINERGVHHGKAPGVLCIHN